MEAYIDAQQKKSEEQARLIAEHQKLKHAQSTTAPQPFEHSRGLYWAGVDRTPFCPRCWESRLHEKIHLFGPVEMHDDTFTRWTCSTCGMDYTAEPGGNYLPSINPDFEPPDVP